MIRIITGGIGSGKTKKLIELQELCPGEGYALVKTGDNSGQDIIRLSDGKIMPFSRTEGNFPKGWDGAEAYDRFGFSRKGLVFAKQIINDIIIHGFANAYIDEIGPLELLGCGVDKEFCLLSACARNLTVAVRDNCLKGCVLRYFANREIEVIDIG